MKVLILSCKTGGGHHAAGFAVKEQLEAMGHEAVVLDYLVLAGEKVTRAVEHAYVDMVKTAPYIFGALYKAGMTVSKRVKKSPVYYANGKMAKYLETYLSKKDFDAIVMPHLYPAETITYMKRQGIFLPVTVAVMTDYTCIPFWEETMCDYYVIPHRELLEECVQRGLPQERLLPAGIPVSLKFSESISKEEARKQLNLKEDAKVHLIIGGSMGAGNLGRLAKEVWKANDRKVTMVVICGSNQKVKRKLETMFDGEEGVRILGQTKEMALYMKASDLVYTKPGGLTSTEAAVAELPIVHTEDIPGCETENKRFFVEHGMSIAPGSMKKQAAQGRELLCSGERICRMQQSQRETVSKEAARQIVEFLEEQVQKRCEKIGLRQEQYKKVHREL